MEPSFRGRCLWWPAVLGFNGIPYEMIASLANYLRLAKIWLTAMVLVTAAVGYVLATPGPIDGGRLAIALLGTGLAVVGAATFNQLLEVDRDAQMERTRGRPLPSGAIAPPHAFLFAMATTTVGLGILNELVNPLTAMLGLVNVLLYTLVYTPLKTRTSLNTLVGSICGALPPVMGWSAATGTVSWNAVLLGLILYLWQVPHFLSFVWLYREDYQRAGYRMLPVTDESGRLTCLMIVLYSLALMPMGLAISFRGIAGYGFAAGSLLMGLGLFLLALQLRANKSRPNARRVFLASIAYLPLLLGLMVADRPAAQRPSEEQILVQQPVE